MTQSRQAVTALLTRALMLFLAAPDWLMFRASLSANSIVPPAFLIPVTSPTALALLLPLSRMRSTRLMQTGSRICGKGGGPGAVRFMAFPALLGKAMLYWLRGNL